MPRGDNSDAMLLRVSDTPALRTAFVEHGGRVVTDKLPVHWGDLAFLADPEGFVFGVEQAIHPREYAPGQVVLPDNLEAERRWRERLAAGSLTRQACVPSDPGSNVRSARRLHSVQLQ